MTNDQAHTIAELAIRLKKERGYAFTLGPTDRETKEVEAFLSGILEERKKCWLCRDLGTYEEETSGGSLVTEYCDRCEHGKRAKERDRELAARRTSQ